MYDGINREALRQILRIDHVGGKHLKGIKSIYANTLIYVRLKWNFGGCSRVGSGTRKGCIMSHWVYDVCMDTVMEEVKMEMGRMEGRDEIDGLLVCRQLAFV